MKTLIHKNSQTLVAASALFTLLAAIYALSYHGVPVSDDEQLFISASQNLVARGDLSAEQMYGNTRLAGRYTGIGPLHPILAAGLYRLVNNTNLGAAQAFFLLTPIYTALTGVVVLLLARRHGFGLRTGLAAGLIYGLTTIAWPYSQSFFREPLAGLLLTSAWLSFEYATDIEVSRRRRMLTFGLFLILYSAAILTKVFILTTLPAFLILIWRRRKSYLPFTRATFTHAIIALMGLLVFLIAVYQPILRSLPADINTRLSETFTVERVGHIIERLALQELGISVAGMLFSPAKGLLLYSPVLLLAFSATQKWGRSRWDSLLVPGSALIGFLLTQFGAYLSAWWNITWSTRFLLPVIPLLVVAALPTLEAMLNSRKREIKYALWGLIMVSIMIQTGGVLIAAPTYLRDLYVNQQVPDLDQIIWNVRHTPMVEHWRLLFMGTPPDLAVWRNYQINPILVTLSALINLGMAAVAVKLVRLVWRSPQLEITRRHLLLGISAALIMTSISPVLTLYAYQDEPRYFAYRSDLAEASRMISTDPRPGDVIVVDDYLSPAWYHVFNFGRPSVPWYSLPLKSQTTGRISTPTLMANLCQEFNRVWLLSELISAGSAAISPEDYLAQIGIMIDEWEWPNSTARLSLYNFSGECQE